ncbi:hypothetical protein ACQ4M3_32570 [Leptolyngbya sp. AN03gr2]|uniref:hypothetical protein n=1 Tax=unclassified Leptolyngbya TaxID=2650499 RepID=UPI003D3227B4
MFQQILLVVDSDSLDRTIQAASPFSKSYGSKLFLLCLETGKDAPLLLFSELNRTKEWSTLSFRNATGTTTLVRPEPKLKIIGMEHSILNRLQGNFKQVAEFASESRSLDSTITNVAQLCKADLAIVNLAQAIDYSDLIHTLNCSVLFLR